MDAFEVNPPEKEGQGECPCSLQLKGTLFPVLWPEGWVSLGVFPLCACGGVLICPPLGQRRKEQTENSQTLYLSFVKL